MALAHLNGNQREAGRIWNLRRHHQMKVPILCYHRVVPSHLANSPWTLTVDQFERGIRRLRERGFHGISLQELRDWQKNLSPLPPKPLVLTFDDGHEGFIERIAPVLQKHGFQATIFLIAGRMGQDAGLVGATFRIMGHEEVRALAAMGFDIEGHGLVHGDWTRMNLSEVQNEIAGSAKIIEDVAGRRPRFIAYPYGKWTKAVRNLVESLGFKGACTTEPGSNGPDQDPFQLKRDLVLPANAGSARAWILNHFISGLRQDAFQS